MLKDICSHNFTPFIGQSCVMYADNGMELPLLVKKVILKPSAQIPTQRNQSREPFLVELQGPANTLLVNAFGILQLPESSGHHGLKIEDVSINRILDMGRDPAYSYFQLIFN